MLLHEFLRIIRPVEWFAVRVFAGPGMIAPDDEVIRAVVAPNNRVPERFAWAAHAHRQRQQRQQHTVGIVVILGQRLIGAHARIVIHVAGLGHAHRWMQQQYAINAGNRALGQFFVNTMQRIARLESDHILMPVGFQPGAHLSGSQAQRREIVVRGRCSTSSLPGNIEFPPALHLGNNRMTRIKCAKRFKRDLVHIPAVLFLDCHDRQQFILIIAQGNRLANENIFIVGDRQRDRHREERAIGEAHLLQHALIIRLPHELTQRRKSADG